MYTIFANISSLLICYNSVNYVGYWDKSFRMYNLAHHKTMIREIKRIVHTFRMSLIWAGAGLHAYTFGVARMGRQFSRYDSASVWCGINGRRLYEVHTFLVNDIYLILSRILFDRVLNMQSNSVTQFSLMWSFRGLK